MTVRHVYAHQEALHEARRTAAEVYDDVYYATDPRARDTAKLFDHPAVAAARKDVERLSAEVAALREEVGGKVYRVVDGKLASLQDRVEKLNRKATKLGTDEIVLTVTDEVDEEVRREAMRPGDAGYLGDSEITGEWIERGYTFHYVVLSGSTPMVPGYAFVAVLDHTLQEKPDDPVPIRRVPVLRYHLRDRPGVTAEQAREELEGIDLTAFRHAPNRCDHCGLVRRRNQTYLLYHLDEGALLQVGSDCLRDYTGANNPERIASWAEWLATLDSDMAAYGDLDAMDDLGSAGGRTLVPVQPYLLHVAACIRENGWTPRWTRDDWGEVHRSGNATADQAHTNAFNAFRGADHIAITEADEKLVADALAWVRDDLSERDNLSEFEHNLTTYAAGDYLPEKGDGIVAYIPMAYRREIERRLEAESQADSNYIANEGDRITLTFKVTFIREFDGHYGVRYLTKGVTPGGDRILWWASKGLEQGETYSGKATIKAHTTDDYNGGAKTTEITRFTGKVVEQDELPAAEDDFEIEVVTTAEEREAASKRRAELKAQTAYDNRVTMLRSRGETVLERSECLQFGDDCEGPVTYHMRPDDGKSFPRCDHHAGLWYEKLEETQEKYGGVAPPSDFDPSYAGERWDEED